MYLYNQSSHKLMRRLPFLCSSVNSLATVYNRVTDHTDLRTDRDRENSVESARNPEEWKLMWRKSRANGNKRHTGSVYFMFLWCTGAAIGLFPRRLVQQPVSERNFQRKRQRKLKLKSCSVCWVKALPELSVGPFSVTRPIIWEAQPNPTQPNANAKNWTRHDPNRTKQQQAYGYGLAKKSLIHLYTTLHI